MGLGRATQPPQVPGIGKKPAALSLEPLTGDGKPVTLQSIVGNVTVVNFWGTWCGPCRQEFPELIELSKELSSHPAFRLFLVSCGQGREEDFDELKAETQAFVAGIEQPVQTHWDPGFKTRSAFNRVATLQGLPTTLVLDRQGVIRGIWPGYRPGCGQEIRQLVLALLDTPEEPKADPAPPSRTKTP